MSLNVELIFQGDSVEDAAQMISDLQVRRLQVVDSDEQLVGIVSLIDLAIKDDESAGKVLESISQSN